MKRRHWARRGGGGWKPILLALLIPCGAVADDTRTLWFTDSAPITIPSIGTGTPYPSVIQLSGVPGTISQVTVALDGLQHSYPADINILLANSRTNVLLIAHQGGGNPITNVNLVFDDAAAASLPGTNTITSGTYKPTNDGTLHFFPSPGPSPPHGQQLGVFAGAGPNDTWSLYILDDSSGDAGAVAGGWRLGLTTTNLLSAGGPGQADLSVTLTDSSDPAQTDQILVWQLTVINSGPAAASGVVVSNTLPAGVQFISATSSQGTCSQSAGLVSCNLGSLAVGAVATVSIQVIPSATGVLTTTAGVSGAQVDPVSANNTASITTAVQQGSPTLSVGDVVVTQRTATRINAVFTVTLSRASTKTVTVDYATADGTAIVGSDYYTESGTLSFAPGTTSLTVSVTIMGERAVQPDEYFYLNLQNPANALISRSQATATVVNKNGTAGRVDHFQWSVIGATQYQNMPWPVTITALDAYGSTVTGFNGAVSITGLTGAGTNTPCLLITEIDLSSDGIELQNLTALPLDLAGWRVYFYDWTSWPDPCQDFDFPAGSIAPPAGVMTIRDTGTAPGSYPSFYTSQDISWFNEATNNPVAVLLVDPSGQPADFFCAVDADPTQIVSPLPIAASQWSGAPVAPNLISTSTYQRTGPTDSNSAFDWQVLPSTMGTANAGLAGPFAGPRPVGIQPSVTAAFSSGVWSGAITALESVTNMYLLASDNDGHAGASGWFAVQPTADLVLLQTATPASLSLGRDITYTLRVTNAGPSSALAVSLVDTLPGTLSYKSASSTQGTVARSGSTITATIGTMAPASQVVVTVIATAAAPGGATNAATVSSTTVDCVPGNNSASLATWVNYPPTITAIQAQSTLDGTPLTVGFSVQDVETPAGSLAVWTASSNPALVPTNNLVLSANNTARTMIITPLADQFGTATITVFVSDSQDTTSTNFQLVVNHRPMPASPTLARLAPVAAKLRISSLVGRDPDGDTVALNSLASISSKGVPVTQDGTWVYYTPPGLFSDADAFTYVVRDARGATNVGTVTLTVPAETNATLSVSISNLGNGTFFVRFAGIPGCLYRIDAAASLDAPSWQTVGTGTADSSGIVGFLDAPPGGVPRYYRLVPSSNEI